MGCKLLINEAIKKKKEKGVQKKVPLSTNVSTTIQLYVNPVRKSRLGFEVQNYILTILILGKVGEEEDIKF